MPLYPIPISYISRPRIITQQVAFMTPEYSLQIKPLGSLIVVEAMAFTGLSCLMAKYDNICRSQFVSPGFKYPAAPLSLMTTGTNRSAISKLYKRSEKLYSYMSRMKWKNRRSTVCVFFLHQHIEKHRFGTFYYLALTPTITYKLLSTGCDLHHHSVLCFTRQMIYNKLNLLSKRIAKSIQGQVIVVIAKWIV